MPKMNISRSIEIMAPADKIHNTLNNFNHWAHWSPWLICEPDAKVTVAEDNKFQEWEGVRIGSGNMKVIKEEENKSIDYELTFLKPWKSNAKTRFEFTHEGDSIKVVWSMDSSLPWFMFWMKNMMQAFIGMDYERGLNMLKEYVEEGVIKSKLDFKGQSSYPGCKYIGIKTNCSVNEIGELMRADFEKIRLYANNDKENLEGTPFSIYHKWDVVKKRVSYTAGVPVKSHPDDLPDGMITGEIPSTEVYTLRHTGPYLHLGNTWSTLYAMHRAKEFKSKKGIHPFEIYGNVPGEVPDEELITDIHFAVK